MPGPDSSSVAVSKNILFGANDQPSNGIYYVNSQFGEALVTNPEGGAIPAQSLISAANDPIYLSYSNLDGGRDRVLNPTQSRKLATSLGQIHQHFKALYDGSDDFAIEIEFKITSEDSLTIKQARPWLNP